MTKTASQKLRLAAARGPATAGIVAKLERDREQLVADQTALVRRDARIARLSRRVDGPRPALPNSSELRTARGRLRTVVPRASAAPAATEHAASVVVGGVDPSVAPNPVHHRQLLMNPDWPDFPQSARPCDGASHFPTTLVQVKQFTTIMANLSGNANFEVYPCLGVSGNLNVQSKDGSVAVPDNITQLVTDIQATCPLARVVAMKACLKPIDAALTLKGYAAIGPVPQGFNARGNSFTLPSSVSALREFRCAKTGKAAEKLASRYLPVKASVPGGALGNLVFRETLFDPSVFRDPKIGPASGVDTFNGSPGNELGFLLDAGLAVAAPPVVSHFAAGVSPAAPGLSERVYSEVMPLICVRASGLDTANPTWELETTIDIEVIKGVGEGSPSATTVAMGSVSTTGFEDPVESALQFAAGAARERGGVIPSGTPDAAISNLVEKVTGINLNKQITYAVETLPKIWEGASMLADLFL